MLNILKKRWLMFSVWCVIVTAVTVPVAFLLTPYLIMAGVTLVLDTKLDKNTMLHTPVPDHTNDMVVMTSPDLLYSLCVYDLSDTDLKITSQVPDSYWSVSFFGTDTMNYFSMNDRQVDGAYFSRILTTNPDHQGPEYIQAPADTGAVIIRIGFDQSSLEHLRPVQLTGRCEPVTG